MYNYNHIYKLYTLRHHVISRMHRASGKNDGLFMNYGLQEYQSWT